MTRALQIIDWSALSVSERAQALRRPTQKDGAAQTASVREIIAAVRERGDAAVIEFTRRFDGVELNSFAAQPEEFVAATRTLSKEQTAALDRAINNVCRFHEAQQLAPLRVETSPGVICEQIYRPIDAVGL